MSAVTASEADGAGNSAEDSRYPAGIPYIVGNEGAERFSFYGMKSILYIYLAALFVRFATEGSVPAEGMKAAEAHATEIVHLFIAGVYLFPLIGAVLADRLLGKYRVIFWVSLIYCLGHGVLAVAGRLGELENFGGAEVGMFLGLGLIAVGSGGIKPCVSANVGDQFTKGNSHLVTRIFQIFYFIINFGSFFSTLLTPYLYRNYGPEIAFGLPGILMGLATFVFWLGRNRFVDVPASPGGRLGLLDTVATVLLFTPFFAFIYGYFVMSAGFDPGEGVTGLGMIGPGIVFFMPLLILTLVGASLGFGTFLWRQRIQPDSGFLAVLIYSLRNQSERKTEDGFFQPARRHFGDEAGDGPPAVLKIMLVFSMVSVFWALFDQHATTWVQQAKQMDLVFVVPEHLGMVAPYAVVLMALFGGTWLMLHVSNIDLPKKVTVGIVGAIGASVVIAGVLDAIHGTSMTVDMQAAQMAALNPLMVMMIIPLLNLTVWGPLRKRNITVRPLQKMTVGMFMAAIAFVIAALLQVRIESAGPGQVHALWQAVPYFIMTMAEVLVSVTGLEFAYTQAPRSMKSTIMGFWLLCVTFGNLIVAFLAPLQEKFSLSSFFWLFAALMGGAALIFMLMAWLYKGKSYLQEA